MLIFILIFVAVLFLAFLRQVNQYETGVRFMMGKLTGLSQPGWRLVIPVFQSMTKVDMRVRTVDVPTQECLTKDNIAVGINAVLYFRVVDAQKAIVNVENFYYASMQLAQTTMRNAIGEVPLDILLSDRDGISDRIRATVATLTAEWGVEVVNLELKDVQIPDDLKRTLAKEAEAERERRAVIIQSEGEIQASKNLAQAAEILSSAPGALHLRTLHSINDISSDQSNTTVWMLPLEIMRGFEGLLNSKK